MAVRKYAVALAFLLVASACGGSSDTAAPTATTTASTTTTQAPTTTTASTTTTTATPAGLAAHCSFDQSVPKITCSVSGATQGSQLRWESNVAGWYTGPSYEIPLEQEHQLVPEVVVTLQECQGSTCQTVEALVDTSILVPTSSSTSSATNGSSAELIQTTTSQPASTEAAPISGSRKNVPAKGFAELIDVEGDVAAWLSRDIIVKTVSLAEPSVPFVSGEVTSLGFAAGVFADDRYVYTSGSRGFAIIDSSDPLSDPIGTYDSPVSRFAQTFIVEEDVVYIASGDQLLILNINNPESPTVLSQTALMGTAPVHMALEGNVLYVPTTTGGGLNILDVSDPYQPETIAIVPFESHSAGFKISGDYAYLGYVTEYTSNLEVDYGFDSSSVLNVLDISNPSTPSLVHSLVLPTDIRDVFLYDNYVVSVGVYTDEFLVIDISSPTAPVLEERPTESFSGASFRWAYQYDDYVYLLDSGSGVWVVDLSSPLAPTVVNRLQLPMTLGCLYGRGSTLYICAEEKYFHFADVSDPLEPVLAYSGDLVAGSFPYTSIVLHNNHVYGREEYLYGGDTYGQFGVFDVTDPYNPEWTSINLAADSIMVYDQYLYTTIGEIGLDVYDIDDFDSPEHISRTAFPAGLPRDASLDSDGDWLVGVSTIPHSIALINVTNPYNPVVTDLVEFSEYVHSVHLDNDLIYVSHGQEDLGTDVFGITPSGTLEYTANIPNRSYRVTTTNDRAYVLSGGGLIRVFNMSNPTQPTQIGSLSSFDRAGQAAVLDGYIYVADGDYGLTVMKLDTD